MQTCYKIPLETYYKIALLMLGKDSLALGFSLANFFANGGKQILINGAAQYGGYLTAKVVGNHVTPEILFPVFANFKLAADFLQASQNTPGQPEIVAMVALMYSTAGLLTKTADVTTNANMGAVIAALVEYMSLVVNSGDVTFAFIRAKLMNLTFRQHVQMEMLLTGLIAASLGSLIIIIRVTLKLFERYERFLKKRFQKI